MAKRYEVDRRNRPGWKPRKNERTPILPFTSRFSIPERLGFAIVTIAVVIGLIYAYAHGWL